MKRHIKELVWYDKALEVCDNDFTNADEVSWHAKFLINGGGGKLDNYAALKMIFEHGTRLEKLSVEDTIVEELWDKKEYTREDMEEVAWKSSIPC